MKPAPAFVLAAGTLLTISGSAFAADSVSSTPGGNDAVSAYAPSSQTGRYVVDLQSVTTSWGNTLGVGPVLKSLRDEDPMFRTQILGSTAVSARVETGLVFPSRDFALWTEAGRGLHPSENNAPASTISKDSFGYRFAVGVSDFSLGPTNLVTSLIGRDSADLSRLYVERTIALASRPTAIADDTASISLGGVGSDGEVFARADDQGIDGSVIGRVSGDNVFRVNPALRSASAVNTVLETGGSNAFSDTGVFIVDNSADTLNPPTVAPIGGVDNAVVFDFASNLGTGTSTSDYGTTMSHLAPGVAGHRGNPSYSTSTSAGGGSGTVGSLALASGPSAIVNTINVFGLDSGSTPPVASGTPRAFTIPSPITTTGFTANSAGTAVTAQYLNQTVFRGGTGHVAVGQNGSGQLVVAAVASDAAQGDFIAVATATSPTTESWDIAAFGGQQILDGENGAPVGVLDNPLVVSAPGLDLLGNVYFVAEYTTPLAVEQTGLFKAVSTPAGYQLELLLSTGESILGRNSQTTYTVQDLTLLDSDSLASGAFHAGMVVQDQFVPTSDPLDIAAVGGLVVNAVISYDRSGTPETYEAVLFVGGVDPAGCVGDWNGDSVLSVGDILDFLGAWAGQSDARADLNGDDVYSVGDILDFLSAWSTGCD